MDQVEDEPNFIQHHIESFAVDNSSLVIHNETCPDEFGGFDPYLS